MRRSAAAPCSSTCLLRSISRLLIRCSGFGNWRIRPSVPPEQLLLTSLLQAFYSIRSERLLLEQLNYDHLFRRFEGLSTDDPICHTTTFTKNRERLVDVEILKRFVRKVIASPEVEPLLSDEHFSVDGTLLQAWASHVSLEWTDGQEEPPASSDPGEGFGVPNHSKKPSKGSIRGNKHSNKIHRSTTDPNALLAPANPMPFRPNPATGAMCSWTTAML